MAYVILYGVKESITTKSQEKSRHIKFGIKGFNILEEGCFMIAIVVLAFFTNSLDNSLNFWIYIGIELLILILYVIIGWEKIRRSKNYKKYGVIIPWGIGVSALILNIINFGFAKSIKSDTIPQALNLSLDIFLCLIFIQLGSSVLFYILLFNYLEKKENYSFYEEFSKEKISDDLIKKLIKRNELFDFYSKNYQGRIDGDNIVGNLSYLRNSHMDQYVELKYKLISTINNNSVSLTALFISIVSGLILGNLKTIKDVITNIIGKNIFVKSTFSLEAMYISIIAGLVVAGLEIIVLEPKKNEFRKILLYFDEAEKVS